jgi:hypothetical protein
VKDELYVVYDCPFLTVFGVKRDSPCVFKDRKDREYIYRVLDIFRDPTFRNLTHKNTLGGTHTERSLKDINGVPMRRDKGTYISHLRFIYAYKWLEMTETNVKRGIT